jgi:hypothetical protein
LFAEPSATLADASGLSFAEPKKMLMKRLDEYVAIKVSERTVNPFKDKEKEARKATHEVHPDWAYVVPKIVEALLARLSSDMEKPQVMKDPLLLQKAGHHDR